MIRVEVHSRVWREIARAPEDVGRWAAEWVKAAQAPGANFSEITQGASALKGRDFRGCFARKWRRKKPHGECRLVFYADENEVTFFSLEPRGGDYKIAQRRIRALPR